MKSNPKVALIILNWNNLSDTIDCLESLSHITYTNHEIVVLDNGSTGDDYSVLLERYGAQYPILHSDRNLGFAGGNNFAIKKLQKRSDIDYLLLLNNDTEVQPNFLDELIQTATSNSKIGIVGPKIYYYDYEGAKDIFWFAGGKLIVALGQPLHRGLNKRDTGQFDTQEDVDFITGCCLLIKKSVYEKLHGFDEQYFSYSEDLHLNVAVKKIGLKIIYNPKSIIFHKASKSLGYKSPNYYYYSTRNRILFVRKNCSLLTYIAYFLPIFSVIRFLLPLFKYSVVGSAKHIKQILLGTYHGITMKLS